MNKQEIKEIVEHALHDDKANFDDVYAVSRSSRSDVLPFVPEFEKLGAIVIVDFVTGDFVGDISSVSGDTQFHVQGAERVYKLGATVLTKLSVQCRVPTVFVNAKKKIELLTNPDFRNHIQMLKAAKSNVAGKLKKDMIVEAKNDSVLTEKLKSMKPDSIIARHKKTLVS